MRIPRLKRKRCHYKSAGEFYRYKLRDLNSLIKNRLQAYLSTAGILNGKKAFAGPTVVQLDITNRCNNNCIVCWVRSPLLGELKATRKWENQELPYERIVSLLDELYLLGTQRIFFAGGGEPFIHPEIIRIIEYAARKNFECHFNTNFTFIDEGIVKKLIALSETYIHINVSLWAAYADTYVRTHPNRSKEDFHKIIEMLKLFARLKKVRHIPHINIYNVISKFNYAQIYDIVRLAYEVQADSVQFVPMDPVEGKTGHLLLNEDEKRTALEGLRKAKDFLDTDLKNKAGSNLFICEYEQFTRRLGSENSQKGEYDKGLNNTPCFVGWEFARVGADGNVYFCLKANDISLGNVYNQNFNSIWTSELYNDLRFKAKALKNSDPLFKQVECHKTCDNIWINEKMQERIKSLNRLDRFLLKGINLWCRENEKSSP